MSESNGKVCCSCGHNIRTGEVPDIKCHCDIDGHRIGYVECMTGWCRRWKRNRKLDKELTPTGCLVSKDQLEHARWSIDRKIV